MVVMALEVMNMLPLPWLVLTPTAVAQDVCSDDADTLLLRAAMVVVALERDAATVLGAAHPKGGRKPVL